MVTQLALKLLGRIILCLFVQYIIYFSVGLAVDMGVIS